ncbi:unnamed protein product [Linum trigynum]|uniref:RNase H type-1 domain-containing protein n=1 Tax=Linum trigynum TaxID=586398 RepID=A0AAV2EX01_9ROSI
MSTPPPLTNPLDWLFQVQKGAPEQSTHFIIYLLWTIWLARNEKVFDNVTPWPPRSCSNATRDQKQWTECPKVPLQQRLHSDQRNHTQNNPDPPPSNPSYEIHCDGSFSNESQEAAYGYVILNNHGQVCDGAAGPVTCSSPIEAEAMAIQEAIFAAKRLNATVHVKSDCLSLVNAMARTPEFWPWACAARLSVVTAILDSEPRIKVEFFSRKNNFRADWIARSFNQGSLPEDWITVLNLLDPFFSNVS